MTNEILWILATVAFLVIEACTSAVVSIWFAGGAVAGLIASMFDVGFGFQIFVFLFVSVILIVFLRKIAFKTIRGKKQDTNLDRIIGSKVVILEEVNNLQRTGTACVGDIEWKVKSEDGEIIEKGETAEVVKIEGVRLVVKK